MFRSRVHLACLTLVAFAPLTAAGTLTVGPAGSGAQFTEIQAAIDAALDNDIILVKPGTYHTIVVDKPLRILGDGAGTVRIAGADPRGEGTCVKILDIAAAEELVLSGVEPQLFFVEKQIRLQDCPGTVVLQKVRSSGVLVEHCARAVLLDSEIFLGGVSVLDSELWLANSVIPFFGGGGVDLVNSTLHVWRSEIYGSSARGTPNGDGGPALNAVGSTVNLFGGPGSYISGGDGGYPDGFGSGGAGGPGVRLTQNSHARIQADLPILAGLGYTAAPPAIEVDGTSSFTYDPKIFPTLVSSAQQVQLGSSFSLTLTGNPGGYQVLYLSLHTGPTTTYRFADGVGLLDRATMVKAGSEVLPPSGESTFQFHVPNNTALLGSTLFFQAAESFPSRFLLRGPGSANPPRRFAMGNPVLVTIPR